MDQILYNGLDTDYPSIVQKEDFLYALCPMCLGRLESPLLTPRSWQCFNRTYLCKNTRTYVTRSVDYDTFTISLKHWTNDPIRQLYVSNILSKWVKEWLWSDDVEIEVTE